MNVSAYELHTALTAVLTAASTDTTLPALCCVRLAWESGTFKAEATDRYRWVEASMSVEGGAGAVLISAKDAAKIVKQIGKPKPKMQSPMLMLTVDNGFTVSGDGWALTCPVEDLQFPDCSRLWPTGDPVPVSSIALNPEFLQMFAKAGAPVQGVMLKFFGEKKPVVTSWKKDGVNVRCLLMPIAVRGSNDV